MCSCVWVLISSLLLLLLLLLPLLVVVVVAVVVFVRGDMLDMCSLAIIRHLCALCRHSKAKVSINKRRGRVLVQFSILF